MAYLTDQVAGSPAVLFLMMNGPVCIAVGQRRRRTYGGGFGQYLKRS
jgi:hypothetical protein